VLRACVRSAVLVGNLVAEMAARRHAEPGDLCPNYAIARRPTDARICRDENVGLSEKLSSEIVTLS